jgi:hypothetical protein
LLDDGDGRHFDVSLKQTGTKLAEVRRTGTLATISQATTSFGLGYVPSRVEPAGRIERLTNATA